jgi:signal peptidase I
MRISATRLLTTLAGLAAVAAVWFFLAPGILGGSTNYVFTSGTSMQPLFHTGDLALVRAGADYRVGEIVAYRSHSLQTIVLHRIVARDGTRYVFKGDNNNFRDPEHPTQSQLVGKLWLQLPGIGAKLSFLRTPRTVGVLAGLAVLLLLGGTAGASQRRRSRRRRAEGGPTEPGSRPRPAAPTAQTGLTVATAALVAFLALGAVAFTRPDERSAGSNIAYTQAGTFSYSADAPAGAVYPNGHAETGDPLFVRLIDRAQMRFDYQLNSALPPALAGTAALDAEIRSNDGWKRTLRLQPTQSFNDGHVLIGGTLDLRAIEQLLHRVETATAATGSATYTLTLHPQIHISGTLGGLPITDDFAPRLPFTLDPLKLRPQLPDTTSQAGTTAAANPLTPTSSGRIRTTHMAPNRLSFHGIHLPVAAARKIATAGALAALCALFGLLLLLLRGRRADEPARIQARHRELLIPVAGNSRRSYDEIVELESFDTLARLAERYDRLILHEQSPLGHSYRVADEGVLYIYLIGNDLELLPELSTTTPSPAVAPEHRRSPFSAKR